MDINLFLELFMSENKVMERYERKFKELECMSGIKKLKELIDYISDNNLFIEFDNLLDEFNDSYGIDSKVKSRIFKEYDFLKEVRSVLSGQKYIKFIFKFSFRYFGNFESTLYLVCLNYYYFNNTSPYDALMKCSNGNFMQCLTMFVDEYGSVEVLPKDYKTFLNKIKNVNFHDNNAKKLYGFIKGYLARIVDEDVTILLFNYIKFSAIYLSACSAVKNGRDVTCEDVVVGYITVLKLLCDDLTPYIEKFYDGGELNE